MRYFEIVNCVVITCTYIQQVFRKENNTCPPTVESFSVIEHLIDTPPACLPLKRDTFCSINKEG